MLALPAAAIAIGLSAVMALAWLVARRTGKSGWIDAIWSFAVGAFGVIGALIGSDAPTHRQWLVAAFAAAWSLRLAFHIARRTLHGGDDPRYRQLQQEWGARAPARLFWFLQIQALVAVALAATIAVAAHRPGDLRIADLIGVVIFVFAIIGETVADRQLTAFARDTANKGRVCDIGLWGLSRHPNYFFEWCVWLAYAPVAIDLAGAWPWGWLALIGPALMYALLVHASGIPPLEAHMLRSRGAAFRAYQARVNAFWPGPQHAPALTPTQGKSP